MRIDSVAGGSNAVDGAVAAKDHKRLADAAQQFEAMLLGELLKPMQASENQWDDGEDRDKSVDTMAAYGTEAVAKAISRAGGLGIARQVLRQVGLESTHNQGNT